MTIRTIPPASKRIYSLLFAFLSILINISYITDVKGHQGAATPSVLSDACLACLCEGSSHCNMTIGCISNQDGQLICGPYGVSKAYWTDAGKPGGGFERCATEPFCAAETVRRYMNKFAQDCNGDDIVNCLDYALLHNQGGYSCVVPDPTSIQLYNFVQACFFDPAVPALGGGAAAAESGNNLGESLLPGTNGSFLEINFS